jgi:hypothetical protein
MGHLVGASTIDLLLFAQPEEVLLFLYFCYGHEHDGGYNSVCEGYGDKTTFEAIKVVGTLSGLAMFASIDDGESCPLFKDSIQKNSVQMDSLQTDTVCEGEAVMMGKP